MNSLPRILLLSLAVFGDVVDSLPKSKKQSWDFWFGQRDQFVKRKSLLNTISRLLKTERIERVIKGGKVKISITPKGLKTLGTVNFDLDKFSNKKWDEKWRLVVFDIEEKYKFQRESIREKLRELGFGKLQESVWMSPFPIERELAEYFDDESIHGEVLITRSDILVGDNKGLANRVWKLEEINDAYESLYDNWLDGNNSKGAKEAFEFEMSFFELLGNDPFLPAELLPEIWHRNKVIRIYLSQVQKFLALKR